MTTTQNTVKAGSKVTVRESTGDWFAKVLWVSGNEACIRELGTKREDIYPLGKLLAR